MADIMAGEEDMTKWKSRWEEDEAGWHKEQVHELLDIGHSVVGVEAIELAITDFYKEQDMTFTVTDVDGVEDCKLYQNEDGRIKIYKCDLFAVNRDIVGSFDAVWDRGSMVAINPCDRKRYSSLIRSLLGKGGRILLESLLYDPSELHERKNRSPFFLPEAEVQALYGEESKVKLLNTKDVLYGEFREAGLTSMLAIMLLISFKV